jgi:peptidoglycan/xylan/chitin deacetylase (PgdA/CDA1 family)
MTKAKRTIHLATALLAFMVFANLSQRTDVHFPGKLNLASSMNDSTVIATPGQATKSDSTAIATISRQVPYFIANGLRTERKIALTFDACATHGASQYDQAVTDVLLSTQTPATMFLSGRWIQKHRKETQLLASVPIFELGNHSDTHPHMTSLHGEAMLNELRQTQDILFELTHREVFLFRPPFGEYNDTLIDAARSLGLITVQYDLASGDPDTSFDANRLLRSVVDDTRNGSIIVMHINRRGWHTAEALPGIIKELRTKGFVFVKVSELLADLAASRGVSATGH